jgi:hypothetical protein
MKVTLRDLLWLALLFGITVSWWLDHRRQERAFHAAIETSQQSVKRIHDLELSVTEARKVARTELEMLKNHDIDVLLEGYEWLTRETDGDKESSPQSE